MECTLASGAKLHVDQAAFDDADALTTAVMSATKGVPFKPDMLQEDITVLKDALIGVAVSPEVKAAFWRCAVKATYENIRVTKELMDDPKLGSQARSDYFEIARKVIEVNCGPFFKPLFSRLKAAFAGTPTASPAS